MDGGREGRMCGSVVAQFTQWHLLRRGRSMAAAASQFVSQGSSRKKHIASPQSSCTRDQANREKKKIKAGNQFVATEAPSTVPDLSVRKAAVATSRYSNNPHLLPTGLRI